MSTTENPEPVTDVEDQAPVINPMGPTFGKYALLVDKMQDDKATELKLCSLARPHMRAFHYAWGSFFIANFMWFAIAPLLPVIAKDLNLSKQDVWTTNIFAVGIDIFMRVVFGALCDKFGARVLTGIVLMLASITTACIGCVNSLVGLIFIRLFIGMIGSIFVMCQSWTSRMFAKEIVGVANGIVGGLGEGGSGTAQLVMGTALFPLFKYIWGDVTKAWRTVFIVPAVVAFLAGIVIVRTSEDCPNGKFCNLKRSGEMLDISATASFKSATLDFNTWVLYMQYACCCGVILTINNGAVSYFVDHFELSIELASTIASIFGLTGIFARGIGGYMSDKAMRKFNMKGRVLVQATILLLEGGCIFMFAQMENLVAATVMLIILSIMLNAAMGSTYGIVPYVNPKLTGSVAGIVGSGGASGAVIFSIGFRQLDTKVAFKAMAGVVVFSGLLTPIITIKGHRGLLFGKDEDDTKTRVTL